MTSKITLPAVTSHDRSFELNVANGDSMGPMGEKQNDVVR